MRRPLSVPLTRLFFREPPNADFAWMGEAHAANFERRDWFACRARGGCPKEEGLAGHGELIGGPGKPRRLLHGGLKPPSHFGFHGGLRPLEWFAHEDALRTGRADPQHKYIDLMITSALAGGVGRPTAQDVYASMTSDAPIADDAAGDLRTILAHMEVDDLPGLMEDEGLSVRQVARALQRSHCRRHSHMDWINGHARPVDADAAALLALRRRAVGLGPHGRPSPLFDPEAAWEDGGGGREPSPWFLRHLREAADRLGGERGEAGGMRLAGRVLADMLDLCPVPMHAAFHVLNGRLPADDDGTPTAAWRTRLRDYGPKLARLLRGEDAESPKLLPHMPLAGALSGPERQALREACK